MAQIESIHIDELNYKSLVLMSAIFWSLEISLENLFLEIRFGTFR